MSGSTPEKRCLSLATSRPTTWPSWLRPFWFTRQAGGQDYLYYDWVDILYAREARWLRDPFGEFADIAAALDIGFMHLQLCMTQRSIQETVRDRTAQARQSGIRSVPTLFVNGLRVQGTPTYAELVTALEATQPRARISLALLYFDGAPTERLEAWHWPVREG